MNDLFSGSFSHRSQVQMTGGVNLDKFFQDVESLKEDLNDLETIHRRLLDLSNTIHTSKSIKDLRFKMNADVTLALKKAKLIKLRLEALDRANAANRSLPNSGPGSSTDRSRTSLVNGLRSKLRASMTIFAALLNKISADYRDTVQRRYFTVTGENPDGKTLDALIEAGESETFLEKAIQEQGRGRVMDTISEIQERRDGVKEMEKNLMELHHVFLDMSVLLHSRGQQVDDIESQVKRASSFVYGGTEQLQTARKLKKNTKKWVCYSIIVLLLITLIVILLTLKPWAKSPTLPLVPGMPDALPPPAPQPPPPPPRAPPAST